MASYNGGTTVITGTDPPCTSDPVPYALLLGNYGGGGIAGTCSGPGDAPGSGTVTCSGPVMAHFHWTADNGLDVELPPPVVVIKETSTAFWSGDGGSCANGLGDPALPATGYSQTSTGVEWTTKTNPGFDFDMPTPRNLSAHCTYAIGGPSGPGGGRATVAYYVNTYPVKIVFRGTEVPGSTDHCLIGQQVVATLDKSGLTWTDDTFTWTVLGGDAFADYQVAPPSGDSAVRTGYTQGTNLSSTTTFFGRPDVSPMFMCATFIGGPIQQTFFVVKSLSTDKPVSNYYIASGQTKQRSDWFDLFMGLYDAPPIPVGGTNHTASYWGMRWAANPLTLSLYIQGNDTGGWHWVQTMVPSRTRIRNGVFQTWSINFTKGLDTSYPYEPEPYQSPNPGRYPANGLFMIDRDAPESGLANPPDSMRSTLDEEFRTYPMYLPPMKPGYEVRWVALKELSWYWGGECDWNGSVWVGPSGAVAGSSFSADFPWQPWWNVRHVATAPWVP